jgi:hypothetical protein
MVLLADPDDKAAVGRDIAATSIGLWIKSRRMKRELKKEEEKSMFEYTCSSFKGLM